MANREGGVPLDVEMVWLYLMSLLHPMWGDGETLNTKPFFTNEMKKMNLKVVTLRC